jgi:RNA polymerase sigma-70 factor (family 1)
MNPVPLPLGLVAPAVSPPAGLPNPHDQAAQERGWLDAICQGDEAAFQAAFNHYHRWLLRVAYGLLYSEHDAQEVVQDVMFNFWARRHELRVRGPLMAYLYMAVRKRSISALRKRRVEQRVMDRAAALEVWGGIGATDALATESELQEAITRAVERLSDRQREIFVLHRFGHMGNAQIGQLLNRSTRTIDTQLHRAYRALRRELTEWLPEWPRPSARF